MDLGLAEQTVLLTGGSGGLGKWMARTFAAEGARVALTYHRNRAAAELVVKEIEHAGGRAMAVAFDLSDEQSIRAAVREVTDTWQEIDTLVVNASPSGGPDERRIPFEEVPVQAWQPQLRHEIEGAFHTTQAVIPVMKAQRAGRIVFISASIVGRGMQGEEAYVTSKAALHGLNRNLATELFAHGILSNVVAPGPTVTEGLLPRVPADVREQIEGKSLTEIRDLLNERIPHLRFSVPDDVAKTVAFLGSPANGNITGSVLNVAGGH